MRNHSIFALAIIALLVVTTAEAKYSGGTGEPNDPYRICTAEDMNQIGANPADWNKHFILVNDVNLAQYTGTKFKIIGNSITPFTGVFDGNGHTISNFTYSGGSGLFGYINDPNSEVKNLTLTNPNVNAGGGGCLAVYLVNGTITGCGIEGGSVSGSGGGLVGTNSSTITNCYSTGSVTGGSGSGGLVGINAGTITNCYSAGNVNGTPSGYSSGVGVGGLVGVNHGTITNCYATGNVNGTRLCNPPPNYVGGLVASNYGTITNCYVTGNVSGSGTGCGYNELYVGGLVAENHGQITNCYVTGSVSGTGPGTGYEWNEYNELYVGGLVAYNEVSGGTITYCYSTGNVSGTGGYGLVGGLVGYGGGVVSSFWNIETSGQLKSAGGAPKNTAEMKLASTYIGWGGCDNNDIWKINNGNDYPHLAWEGKPGQPIPEQKLSDYVPGSGTESDPYLISTAQQLLICSFPCEWDKHFALVADINLGTQVNIIGTPSRPFTGVFDGKDHKIWNFTWDSNGASYIGLFGYVAGTSQIKNVGLENVNVNAANGDYIGGLVGDNYGTITNCYSTGSVSGGGGGLVGGNGGTITNCYSTSSVSGGSGLVGDNSGTITNCYSIGSVSGGGGGLVGSNSGTITNCYSTGSISGVSGAGGLVGVNHGTITNCYARGDIVVSDGDISSAGGLVGRNSGGGTIINCYSTGSVSSGEAAYHGRFVGGLVGINYDTITNCYSTGSVSGDGCVGGLVGWNDYGTITNCYSSGSVSGRNCSGGME